LRLKASGQQSRLSNRKIADRCEPYETTSCEDGCEAWKQLRRDRRREQEVRWDFQGSRCSHSDPRRQPGLRMPRPLPRYKLLSSSSSSYPLHLGLGRKTSRPVHEQNCTLLLPRMLLVLVKDISIGTGRL